MATDAVKKHLPLGQISNRHMLLVDPYQLVEQTSTGTRPVDTDSNIVESDECQVYKSAIWHY